MFVNKIAGVIQGCATVPQEGWSNEELADDDVDLLAYVNRPTAIPSLVEQVLADPLAVSQLKAALGL